MNYSVLIVDDEEANLSLFKMVFAEEFEVYQKEIVEVLEKN